MFCHCGRGPLKISMRSLRGERHIGLHSATCLRHCEAMVDNVVCNCDLNFIRDQHVFMLLSLFPPFRAWLLSVTMCIKWLQNIWRQEKKDRLKNVQGKKGEGRARNHLTSWAFWIVAAVCATKETKRIGFGFNYVSLCVGGEGCAICLGCSYR